ncbi:MAG: hypothetical protein AAGA77_13215 [Bacteroidota bacterium]
MKKVVIRRSDLIDGEFKVSGYKHASNVVICAAMATAGSIQINNIPKISDTEVLCQIIKILGGASQFEGESLIVDCSDLDQWEIPADLSILSHASIYLMPVILGKLGKVKIGKTGGCMIGDDKKNGERPVNHMLSVLSKFGATFNESSGFIHGTSNTFTACEIDISDYSTRQDVVTGPLISGATKTAILAALLTEEGVTTIKNPYQKPDVTELLEFASNNGYDVDFTTERIKIYKNKEHVKLKTHDLLDDISTIMTYITTALYNEISIKIRLRQPQKVQKGLKAEMEVFRKMGVKLIWNDNLLIIPKNQEIKSTNIEVTSMSIYSDHQPFFALLLTKANDKSSITEYVWKKRFSYARELNKLSSINPFTDDGRKLEIQPAMLSNGSKILVAEDLRSAAVLLLASLGVEGSTMVENIDHLARGYENLIGDLIQLNANIKLIN